MKVLGVSQDGLWGVLEGKDFVEGIGRSRTAKTVGEALKNTWEPNLTTMPGPASLLGRYVKVRLMDISSHPDYIPYTGLPLSAVNFRRGAKAIPDYPQRCLVCGQDNVVITLFSSTEHKGECPGPQRKEILRGKVRFP